MHGLEAHVTSNSLVPNMTTELNEPETASATTTEPLDSINVIREALQGLQFGQVTVIVQDGVVVQVDRTEKRRVRQRKVS